MFWAVTSQIYAQGSLTPPGAPAPVFKTLNQVEPRTPISSLPFLITNSGSYYLTGNLTGTGTADGITVQSNLNDVTIDLKGFELVGGPSSSIGIYGTIFPGSNLVVMNGTIRNWFFGVVAFGKRCRLENLQVFASRSAGIEAGDDGVVRHCIAADNAGLGLQGGFRSVIEDCLATSNGSPAILTGAEGVVRRCTVAENLGIGIQANNSPCVISDCIVTQNPLDGIQVKSYSVVKDNVIVGLGNSAGTNACIHGITGLNRFENNSVSLHQLGIREDGTSSLIIRNVAMNNHTNYFIPSPNNQVGPTNSGFGPLTNHPWANFSL